MIQRQQGAGRIALLRAYENTDRAQKPVDGMVGRARRTHALLGRFADPERVHQRVEKPKEQLDTVADQERHRERG